MTQQDASASRYETREHLRQQRWELLEQLNTLLDKPMIALSFLWIALLVMGFTVGLNGPLTVVSNVIWAIFIVDFLLEFLIAPHKRTYLKRHWLTALSLVLPAFRVLRVLRAVRMLRLLPGATAAESASLVRIVGGINRGMSALNVTLGRRNIGYLLGLTVIVIFIGAAGMASFESQTALIHAGYQRQVSAGAGFRNFGDALWWTAMIMTTMGSQYWPITGPGRILCFLLALYAFAVFGYITATIATYFLGRDQERHDAAAATTQQAASDETAALRQELQAMRAEMAALMRRLDAPQPPAPSRSLEPASPV